MTRFCFVLYSFNLFSQSKCCIRFKEEKEVIITLITFLRNKIKENCKTKFSAIICMLLLLLYSVYAHSDRGIEHCSVTCKSNNRFMFIIVRTYMAYKMMMKKEKKIRNWEMHEPYIDELHQFHHQYNWQQFIEYDVCICIHFPPLFVFFAAVVAKCFWIF